MKHADAGAEPRAVTVINLFLSFLGTRGVDGGSKHSRSLREGSTDVRRGK